MLLDDHVAGPPLDDRLDVRVLVPRRDQEPRRLRAHLLEGGRIDLDRNRAAGGSALADQLHQLVRAEAERALVQIRDADVDLAEECLVADHPRFPR